MRRRKLFLFFLSISSIEPAFTVPNGTNQYYTKKNTSITNLKSSEPLTKSSRSLSKTLSRSSSKEPRSRNPSGQRSEHNSPHTFRKVVQYFTASQMMGKQILYNATDWHLIHWYWNEANTATNYWFFYFISLFDNCINFRLADINERKFYLRLPHFWIDSICSKLDLKSKKNSLCKRNWTLL